MSFRFKQFYVEDSNCAMKVGTDGVLLGCFIGSEMNNDNLTFNFQHSTFSCLDIGTGSGLISLMVAQQLPDAQILGIEIDEDAALQAQANFAASPWAERLTAQHGSLQEFVGNSNEQSFNLIFSNPPFFQNSLKNPDAQRCLARHTDSLSVDYLYVTASQLLVEEGHFCVILPYQLSTINSQPSTFNLQLVSRLLVRGHGHKPFKRQLLHYIKTAQPLGEPLERTLTLQDQFNHRTPEYQQFAQEFYL